MFGLATTCVETGLAIKFKAPDAAEIDGLELKELLLCSTTSSMRLSAIGESARAHVRHATHGALPTAALNVPAAHVAH